MPKYLTKKTILRCSCSITPGALEVTSQMFYKINGLKVATASDNKPIVNIPCFGNCMQCSPLQPCIPIPLTWEKLSTHFDVNGSKCLTQNSYIRCARGGIISILFVAQETTEEDA
ncbi:DUF4280 domain-containing protein [Tannerella forsythia]|uniref:DUF4280 domain-containing protein n=1 Tax=Tannerella forsythia TaxID=28112 RepID=A0A3P1YQI0_TANFO|nr:DUF4280 domain-containing protein [Tannerella forsythia]